MLLGPVKNNEYGYLELCMKKYEETPYIYKKLELAQQYAGEHAATDCVEERSSKQGS